MAIKLPPPPIQEAEFSNTWRNWFLKVKDILTGISTLSWALIDFTNSKLSDIIDRKHSDLQGLTSDDHPQYLTEARGDLLYAPIGYATDREALTADRTYYVSTTGSNSNDGLTPSTPFLTIQYAVDVIRNTLDLKNYKVTIQLADGTYDENVVVSGYVSSGDGYIEFTGNAVTPTNVVWTSTTEHTLRVTRCIVHISNFEIRNGLSGYYCVSCYFSGLVNVKSGMVFGSTVNGRHLYAVANGIIGINSVSYTISGSATYHVVCDAESYVGMYNPSITLTGTPAFTYFVIASGGSIHTSGLTYSGSATGSRYRAQFYGVINGTGGVSTYFPGSTAGSVSNGLYA